MSLHFSDHVQAPAVVYDCMDELSNFAGAPPGLRDAERALLERAGVVFTGGRSLYEAKKHLHPNIHPFPSSVDVKHFASARANDAGEPADQSSIPHPRIGFFGVLDERLDRDLIAGVAALRPDWHLVLLGPVVKIDPSALPQAANIHYLGQKSYASFRGIWPGGTWPCCRSRAMRRRASSVRRRHPNTWQPDNRSSPPRFVTLSVPMAIRDWSALPTAPRTSSRPSTRRSPKIRRRACVPPTPFLPPCPGMTGSLRQAMCGPSSDSPVRKGRFR